MLSEMGMKGAFRKIAIENYRSPVFGYTFEDFIVTDRRPQFRWRNSPGCWCLFTQANHVRECGSDQSRMPGYGTRHSRTSAEGITSRAAAPLRSASPGTGGGVADPFFVECYVDYAISVGKQWHRDGRRLGVASESLASYHVRLLGDRRRGDPTPIIAEKRFVVGYMAGSAGVEN